MKHLRNKITVYTLGVWHKLSKLYTLQEQSKILKWINYGKDFTPARCDSRNKKLDR